MAEGPPRTIHTVTRPTEKFRNTALFAMVKKTAPTRALMTYLVSVTRIKNLSQKANVDPGVLITTLMAVGSTAGLNVNRAIKAKLMGFTDSQIAMERNILTPAMSRVVKGHILRRGMEERRRVLTNLPTWVEMSMDRLDMVKADAQKNMAGDMKARKRRSSTPTDPPSMVKTSMVLRDLAEARKDPRDTEGETMKAEEKRNILTDPTSETNIAHLDMARADGQMNMAENNMKAGKRRSDPTNLPSMVEMSMVLPGTVGAKNNLKDMVEA